MQTRHPAAFLAAKKNPDAPQSALYFWLAAGKPNKHALCGCGVSAAATKRIRMRHPITDNSHVRIPDAAAGFPAVGCFGYNPGASGARPDIKTP